MSPKRKILTFSSIIAFVILVIIGLNEKNRHRQRFLSTFSQMVVSTDKALLEFSEIDEKYLKGEETKENYEEAWYDLNFKLEQIKKQDDRLQNPPKELEELVILYRSGFYRVFSVTNDVVDYLSGETKDPMIIVEDREKFEEGLKMLREVKDKLEPAKDVI